MLPAKAHRAPGAPVVAARALTFVAATVLALAGCGDEDDDAEAPPSAGDTELTITLDADGPGGDEALVESAACDAGAFHAACEGLAVTDLAPLDPETPCTEIYGGPDTLELEGTLDGEDVAATFTRANGCEIDRFDRLTPLLRELFPEYRPGETLEP